MEFIELLTMLVSIIFVSKVVAKITKTVDIIWYIIFGLLGTQYVFHIDASLLENWATLGVIFIMFYAGWKEDLVHFLGDVWKNKWVALIAAAGPFIGGLIGYKLLNFSITEAVVAGFIFTSSAVPYTIAVLTNLKLEKTKAAKAAISSSVADNFISILLAVGILPAYALLKNGTGTGDLGTIGLALAEQVGLVFAAFIIFAILGLFILPDARMNISMNIPNAMQKNGVLSRLVYFIYKIRKGPGLNSVMRKFASMRISIPLTLLLIFSLAWLAHRLGLHPAIAAYLTGLILHFEMYSESEIRMSEITNDETPLNHKNLSVFFYFVQEWIGPIFFIYLGSQLIADWSRAGFVFLLAIGASVVVGAFQFGSAYFAGRKTSKLSRHDATLLGLGMLPCDVIAFVVLGIATTTGLIEPEGLFVITVIISILIINVMTSLLIYWYRPKYLRKEKEYALDMEQKKET